MIPVRLDDGMPVYCATCREVVRWEMIARGRLFREVNGARVFRTRCGCGSVNRDQNGKLIAARVRR